MAYQATNWAWEIELPMAQKFVLIALADMADESFSCFPGQRKLSSMTGAGERTVRRALKELEETGLLVREERRAKDGYRTSDRYILRVGEKPTGQFDRQSSQGESHRPLSPISPATESNLTGQSGRAIEPPVEPPEESPDLLDLVIPSEGDRFEEFWAVWPRKDAKKKAAESWARALKKVNQHALIVAAKAYANSPYLPEKKFIPHASTWLNQERWSDPLPSASLQRQTPTDRALATIALGQEQKAVGA